MSTLIKTETWTVKGKKKRYITVRINGKLNSRRKWGGKERFFIKNAITKFKNDKTLLKDVKKEDIGNVMQVIDSRIKVKDGKIIKRPQIRKSANGLKQYVIIAKLKNGKTINARSKAMPLVISTDFLRDRAINNFYKLLGCLLYTSPSPRDRS